MSFEDPVDYRKRAQGLRRLAKSTTDDFSRGLLTTLANDYDIRALAVENRQRKRRTARRRAHARANDLQQHNTH